MITRSYNINSKFVFAVFLLLLIWIFLAIMDPVLMYEYPFAANTIHDIYAPVCHQIPARSFQINSYPMGFCVRCFGFYLSGMVILFYYLFRQQIKIFPIYVYVLFTVPLLCDFAFEKLDFYHELILVRFLTGGLLGLSLFHLFIVSLSTREDVFDLITEKMHG